MSFQWRCHPAWRPKQSQNAMFQCGTKQRYVSRSDIVEFSLSTKVSRQPTLNSAWGSSTWGMIKFVSLRYKNKIDTSYDDVNAVLAMQGLSLTLSSAPNSLTSTIRTRRQRSFRWRDGAARLTAVFQHCVGQTKTMSPDFNPPNWFSPKECRCFESRFAFCQTHNHSFGWDLFRGGVPKASKFRVH